MSLDVNAVNPAPLIPTRAQAPERPARRAEKPKEDLMKTQPPVSIRSLLKELAEVSAAFDRRLSFSVNEKLDMVVVKVIDTETDKVIREIPAAELQHVHERIREVIGILFDEKA